MGLADFVRELGFQIILPPEHNSFIGEIHKQTWDIERSPGICSANEIYISWSS